MDPEDKEDSKEFGKVVDTLHSKQKLPSLRTYQGDMAEFIKEKNESVISIAVKEKEKKQKEEKYEDLYSTQKPASSGGGFKMNLTILLLSIFLIGGGILASLYIFKLVKRGPVSEVVVEEKIIPYNNLITLANVTKATLGSELVKLSPAGGISVIKMSDANGLLLQKAKDLFNLLEISLPATLGRTLKDEYIIGAISQNEKPSFFLVIVVNDFGGAFSGMLSWEENMAGDLSFFNTEAEAGSVINTVSNIAVVSTTSTASTTANAIASSTATTTIVSVKIPMKPETFSWKDVIIKNKDTRALVNQRNQAKIAYTFLDKNTILITNSLSAIGDISSAYASRSVAR